ncbi:MAG: hypothetical protein U0S12_03305 [Fimbriimonadales bacterium]
MHPARPRSLYRNEAPRRHSARNLKVCPLCGALNAATNGACFVCTWQGKFLKSSRVIEEALSELVERSPELAEAVRYHEAQASPNWRQRIRAWFRKPLDLWA